MSPSSTMEQKNDNNGKISDVKISDTIAELYVIQEVAGKGKGMIANRDIEPGTLILSESPLFTTKNITSESSLRALIKSLPKASQKAFLYLHNAFPGSPNPFIHIIRSNAYPLGPSSQIGAIFPTIARINHSCLPNAQHSWNPQLQKEVIYAIFPIRKGEEITLSYHPGGPSKDRKEQLKNAFNFTCTCTKCSLPPHDLEISDTRLHLAATLDSQIGNSQHIKNHPKQVLRSCKQLLQIFEDEGVRDTRLPRVYYDAFQICAMHSDAARASVFARKYRDFKVLSEGGGSVDAEEIEGFVGEPQEHDCWGLTGRWRSSVGDVPRGLGDGEFEMWLWRVGV